MKNRRHKLSIVLICICAVAILASVYFLLNKKEYIAEVNEQEVTAAYNLLNNSLNIKSTSYIDFLESTAKDYGQEEVHVQPDGGVKIEGYDGIAVTLDYDQHVQYKVNMEKPGLYYLNLDYKPMEKTLTDFHIDIEINETHAYDEMKSIALPLRWKDETKDYPKDRYLDETAPLQVVKDEWNSLYLYGNTYNTVEPLLFYLDAGENIITLTNISGEGLGVGSIKVEAPVFNTPTYVDYRKEHKGSLVSEYIPINSIEYIEKNTTQALVYSENNPALTPHSSEYKLLNTVAWNEAGSEVTYQYKVPSDGFYHIAFHYKSTKEEFDVFQTIRIDGKVPFQELKEYAFHSTGSSWDNEVLSDKDGKPYEIYLSKGTHLITIRAEQEPVTRAYQLARLITLHVSQLELEITKITGTTKDSNRTWQMTRYIPKIPDYLSAYETLIQYIKYSLQDYTPNGVNSAMFADLDKAMEFIDQMSKYPDEIALYKKNLTSARDNSVLKSMSNFATKVITQDFALDMIYVYGDQKLPKAKAGIFATIGNGFMKLVNSYISPKFKIEEDPEAVNIWVNRATTHVDLLQKMADTKFTPESGIKVKISIMPDQNKLILGAAADETPDVALGLGSHIPFELASRGALYDLTQFDDYWLIADRFVPGESISYIYNEGIYAIPETLDFNALIYRSDIFDSIGLTPPDTWQEVTEILPTLQRYGMNFFHNISSGVGYKWYWQTSPLIFQNNGQLFTQDGFRTAIDQPNAVKGIQALGDLFIAYSLPKEVISFFNSFRYSTLPVGIVNLNDYILIKNGAPELEGRWALAPYPGTVQEDGSISRWYIANGTAGVIFNDSKKIKDSWEFLKWWTDYETQVDYTYTLQSTYGKTFVWLSSNVEAVADSPIDEVDKRIILDQIKWLRDVVRTPGQYLVERSLSDIWNAMVNEGVSAQVAIDEQVIGINREIRKKMKELGYYDDEGNLLRPYVIHDIDWIIEQINHAKQEVK